MGMLLFTCTLVGFGYFYLLFVWGPLFWESSFGLSFNISSCLRFRFFIYLVRISDMKVQKRGGRDRILWNVTLDSLAIPSQQFFLPLLTGPRSSSSSWLAPFIIDLFHLTEVGDVTPV